MTANARRCEAVWRLASLPAASLLRRRLRHMMFSQMRNQFFLIASTLVLMSVRAAASCLGPSEDVLWSYPADGDVGIPTNAQLYISTGELGVPSLEGVQLSPGVNGGYELGELKPDTTYHVTWSVVQQHSITFTTGAGPALQPAPMEPEPLDITRSPSDVVRCDLVPPQGCFDTGPPKRARFAPRSTALAWLVDTQNCAGFQTRMIWPAECGPPTIESEDGRICVRLRATDGVHLSDATELICSTPLPSPDGSTPAVPSECVSPFPPTSALTVAGEAGVTCSSDAGATCLRSPPGASAGTSGGSSATAMSSPNLSNETEPASASAEMPTSPVDVVSANHSSGCALSAGADAHAQSAAAIIGLALVAMLAASRTRRADHPG